MIRTEKSEDRLNVPRGAPMLLVIACLFSACLAGEAAGESGQGSIFLWSITSGKNNLYLLGSLHVLTKDAYPLDERLERAYLQSTRVVFEADMAEVNNPEIRSKMLASGMYRDGTSLADHISKETYSRFKAEVAKTGLSMEQLDLFKPWLCAITLGGVEMKRLGFVPGLGLEAHFFTMARRDKKEMTFLESAGSQIDLVSSLPEDTQEDLLKQTIAELGVIGQRSGDLLDAWKRGDTLKMESIVSISLKEFPEIRDRLFVQRNTSWVDRIEELLKSDEAVLVIVGSGHLVGDRGVLAQLRERGYTPVQQ